MLYKITAVPPDYLKVIEMIVALRTRLRYALSDERRRWTGVLRRSTLAKAIQGSNSIEGYNVNYNDAIAAVDGEEPVDATEKEWANILGYRQAMTYALQVSGDKYLGIEDSTMRAMHFMMLSHDMSAHPGIWRKNGIFVTRDPEGVVVYEGPPPEDVPALMVEFVKSLNEQGDQLPVMVKAALAHLNLVMIHPFSDGNGRMGRAIQTLMLARDRIVDPVFSSIEEWLGAHTQPYYEVLGEVGKGGWHPENDPMPFVRFCLKAHYQQAERLLVQDQKLQRVWLATTEILKKRRLMERMVWALADASIGIRVRNSSYRNQVQITNESASKDLRTLVMEGLLIPKGERKGRYYEASDELRSVAKSVSTPWSANDPFDLVAVQEREYVQPDLPGVAG